MALPHRRAFLIALPGVLFAQKSMAQQRPLRIVALGDSLTAGYGLPADAAFPNQLERALRARGHQVAVANAGVSGDTTAGGRERLDWSVPDGTDAVILELGANDALRGLSPQRAEAALDAILQRLTERRIPVLIAGMYAPRSLGPEYVAAFDPIYPRLAERHGALLYPFFLDGVMDVRGMTLDGLHPTREGVAIIVERILPQVEELIGRARAR
jgi:acyl-CoA thioesterase-1